MSIETISSNWQRKLKLAQYNLQQIKKKSPTYLTYLNIFRKEVSEFTRNADKEI